MHTNVLRSCHLTYTKEDRLPSIDEVHIKIQVRFSMVTLSLRLLDSKLVIPRIEKSLMVPFQLICTLSHGDVLYQTGVCVSY